MGRYVLGDEIARGGMGVVYRALDPAFGRDVAVKLIQPHLARQPAACARFRNMGVSLRSAGQALEALAWFARGQASIEPVVAGDLEARGAGQCLLAIRLNRAEALEELKQYGEADTNWEATLEAGVPATKPEIQAQREQWRARRPESD